jgi:hypothetical protein
MSDEVEHCWLLDLDRTLSSVDIVMEAVEYLCKEMNLDFSKVEEEQKLVESRGDSFTISDTIRLLWPECIDEFCEKFRHMNHIDSIYPDARDFLSLLRSKSLKFCIITFSSDSVWQESKISANGLSFDPYIICDIPEKSVLLRQYFSDGKYEIATSSGIIKAKKVTLVDDKLRAFTNMPKGARSIFMNRSRKEVVVPNSILEVSSFSELMGEIL